MNGLIEREAVEEVARKHARALWGICYRMTGDAADADDLVQETLARALERPRAQTEVPIDRWLATIAVNLSRDRLRQRKRIGYPSPWLPSPVETDGPDAAPVLETIAPQKTPAARYELLESVTFAFLLALEALTPQQRSVLILRDVFDYSVKDAAEMLAISEANVKTTHLRARKVMEGYDRDRCVPTPERVARCQAALWELMRCLQENDAEGAKEVLSRDVLSINDGGGEFFAANKPLRGVDKVVLFTRRIFETRAPPSELLVRMINGLPALIVRYEHPEPKMAPLVVTTVGIDQAGMIDTFHSVLATRKLKAIRVD